MAYLEQTDWSREDIRRRGLGLAIALLLEVIIILAIRNYGDVVDGALLS